MKKSNTNNKIWFKNNKGEKISLSGHLTLKQLVEKHIVIRLVEENDPTKLQNGEWLSIDSN